MELKGVLSVVGVGAVLVAAGCSGGGSSEPDPLTLTVTADAALSGSARSFQAPTGEVFVWDPSESQAYRGFVTFDLGGLPAGAQVTKATLDLSANRLNPPAEDPFSPPYPVGNFMVLAQDYGTLDPSDYAGPTYATLYDASAPASALASVDASGALAAARARGYGRLQVRLQFAKPIGHRGPGAEVRFDEGRLRLVVEYR